jgi:hypothetical protein
MDSDQYREEFMKYVHMNHLKTFTDAMWAWVKNIANNNTSDLVRLLILIRDIHETLGEEMTLSSVQSLCSAPFYYDFIPLLQTMSKGDLMGAIQSLLQIWKRGYAYEDILESFQIINSLFGNHKLEDNILIHKFLINAWISYCKGNTSILALQNVVYKTLKDDKPLIESIETVLTDISQRHLNS